MAHWRHKLSLKDLLTDDEDPETVKRVSKAVHERLESFRKEHYPHDDELEEISYAFYGLAFDEDEPTSILFNWTMDDLYDWGDDGHRLWID